MLKKVAALEEAGARDTAKERMENKKREIYQMKKSDAIIKFESVMSNMLTNTL